MKASRTNRRKRYDDVKVRKRGDSSKVSGTFDYPPSADDDVLADVDLTRRVLLPVRGREQRPGFRLGRVSFKYSRVTVLIARYTRVTRAYRAS